MLTSATLKICRYVFLILLLQACVSTVPVSKYEDAIHEIEEASQHPLPSTVNLHDGLSNDEAAMTALANNAEFQVALSELGLTRADLTKAKELPNPVFTILFPVDTTLNEFSVAQMISFLWQRPGRAQTANLKVEQVAEDLMQKGIALVRDTNIAHAEYVYTKGNALLLQTLAETLSQTADAVTAKFHAGEASEIELVMVRNDALQAQDKSIAAGYEAKAASFKLKNLMGLTDMTINLNPIQDATGCESHYEANDILEKAFASRPDLEAARVNIAMAGERAGLEKANILNLTATLDATEKTDGEYNFDPRLSIEIPLFSQNQGGRERAKAELKQAASQYIAMRHEITLQVYGAVSQMRAACERLVYWENEILPQLKMEEELVRKNYEAGEIAHLSVLTNQQKLIEAERSIAAATLNQKKALANLHFSIGQKVPEVSIHD